MSEPEPSEPAFEAIVARLEAVVRELESGELPLERSLALFEEGVRLARAGGERLDRAEMRVEELLAASEQGARTRALELGSEPRGSAPSDPSKPNPRGESR